MAQAKEFFGKDRVTLYHGSPNVVKQPVYGVGNPNNDYGLAFYTTELEELALEWACPRAGDGWANEYVLGTRRLSVLDLNSDEFSVLNWLAVLLEHRKVSMGIGIAQEAHGFITAEYAVDVSGADIVYGYRADDSYFSMARRFLNNGIPVEVLEQALFLGGLGHQVALMSERALKQLEWMGARPASGAIWNPRRIKRDAQARATATQLEKQALSSRIGTYIVDIMRGEDAWRK